MKLYKVSYLLKWSGSKYKTNYVIVDKDKEILEFCNNLGDWKDFKIEKICDDNVTLLGDVANIIRLKNCRHAQYRNGEEPTWLNNIRTIGLLPWLEKFFNDYDVVNYLHKSIIRNQLLGKE